MDTQNFSLVFLICHYPQSGVCNIGWFCSDFLHLFKIVSYSIQLWVYMYNAIPVLMLFHAVFYWIDVIDHFIWLNFGHIIAFLGSPFPGVLGAFFIYAIYVVRLLQKTTAILFVVLHSRCKEMTSSGQLVSSQAPKSPNSRKVSSVIYNTPPAAVHGNEYSTCVNLHYLFVWMVYTYWTKPLTLGCYKKTTFDNIANFIEAWDQAGEAWYIPPYTTGGLLCSTRSRILPLNLDSGESALHVGGARNLCLCMYTGVKPGFWVGGRDYEGIDSRDAEGVGGFWRGVPSQ